MGRSIKLGKKAILLASGLVLASAVVAGTALVVQGANPTIGADSDYSWDIYASSFGNVDPNQGGQWKEQTVSVANQGGYEVDFTCYGLESLESESSWSTFWLGDYGYFFNATEITAITSVTVEFSTLSSSTLKLIRGWETSWGEIEWQDETEAVTLTTGTKADLSSVKPNYIKFLSEGSSTGGGVSISSINIQYVCDESYTTIASDFTIRLEKDPTLNASTELGDYVPYAKVSLGNVTDGYYKMSKDDSGFYTATVPSADYGSVEALTKDQLIYSIVLGTDSSYEDAATCSISDWKDTLGRGQTTLWISDTASFEIRSGNLTLTLKFSLTFKDSSWPTIYYSINDRNFTVSDNGTFWELSNSKQNPANPYSFENLTAGDEISFGIYFYYWYDDGDYFVASDTSGKPFTIKVDSDATWTVEADLSSATAGSTTAGTLSS